MTDWIWVTAEKEFMHKYPDAPRTVSFLRNEHRHNFKFRLWAQVFEDDRDIEFIIFQRYLKGILFKMPFDLGAKSCEMIGKDIIEEIQKKYKGRRFKIEVSEDGENGAVIEYP